MTPASPAQDTPEASAELTPNHEQALLRKGEQLGNRSKSSSAGTIASS